MDENAKIRDVIKSFKEYYHTCFELWKLQAIDKSSTLGAGIISSVLIGIVVFLFVLFISLFAGLFLSDYLHNTFIGFGIVAAFYLLLGLILIICRKKIIESPIRNIIIRKILDYKKK